MLGSAAASVSWHESPFILLAALVVFGVASQWIAWRMRLPSILVLLLVGFLLGPVTGILRPDDLFGKILFPFVSLSVALILYEGGLSLRFRDLKEVGSSVRNLVTIGALITWLLTSLAAVFILGLPTRIAVLLGAILIVTGPTVIIPLLHHIQPHRRTASLLKWEGIVIDPVGAMLAVLVFEVVRSDFQGFNWHAVLGLGNAVLTGGLTGMAGAWIVWVFFRRYWIPDLLHNPFSLMVLLTVFSISNVIQPESGLLTATVMGIALANQKSVDMRHIVEFKENLRTLLISVLFILLAARVALDDLWPIPVSTIVFLLVLLIIIRPATVWLSTIGGGLSSKEKWFLSWMAPRGIVAAAVASVFALELERVGMSEGRELVPITFAVIIGTVLVYGLTSRRVAMALGQAQSHPQGMIIVGAHYWARHLAAVLQEEGLRVMLLDSNRANVHAASMMGLEAYCGNVFSEQFFEELDLSGIGRLLAITPNDEVNSLATLRLEHPLETSEVYQLPAPNYAKLAGQGRQSHAMHGRLLFAPDATFSRISERVRAGDVFKKTNITETFKYEDYKQRYSETALPMFAIDGQGRVTVLTAVGDKTIKPGQKLISLVSA
jgi:NhaP-type Na+/H+ or K+/H+ antiporter